MCAGVRVFRECVGEGSMRNLFVWVYKLKSINLINI